MSSHILNLQSKKNKFYCIPITFNNSLKVCFSKIRYVIKINPNTPKTNFNSLFLIEKPVKRSLVHKINYLHIPFCLDLVCNKTLRLEIRPHAHTFLIFDIPIAH